MNKKLILFACALVAGNASFGMNVGDPGMEERDQTPIQPIPSAPPAAMLAQDNRRIDDTPTSTITSTQSSNNEPAAISAQAIRHRKTGVTNKVTELLAMGYANAPKQVQMMCDEAAKHPKAIGTAAFLAGECCMWNCCPEISKIINYAALGWGAHAVYSGKTKKN